MENITSNKELINYIRTMNLIIRKKEKQLTKYRVKMLKYKPEKSEIISVDSIKENVCNYFGLPVDHLNSQSRKREIVQTRQICHYFAKKYTKLSLIQIGWDIGGKDHATVLHSIKTVNNLMDTDIKYRKMIDNLNKML